ncbi:hypothetical protein ACPFP2_18330 [Micromonospora citrea]
MNFHTAADTNGNGLGQLEWFTAWIGGASTTYSLGGRALLLLIAR